MITGVSPSGKAAVFGTAMRRFESFHPNLTKGATLPFEEANAVLFSGASHPTLANAIAKSDAYSIVGGGDSISAIEKLGILDKFSFVSTGGGAFLEYIEGKILPAIAELCHLQMSNGR